MCCGNNNIDVFVPAIPEKCINPIAYLVDKAVKLGNLNGTSISVELFALLNNGFFSQNKGLFCCHACEGNDSFYFFGGSESLITLTTAIPSWSVYADVLACCVNYEATVNTALEIENSLQNISADTECCTSDFQTSLQSFFSTFPTAESLLDLGVVEISTFDGTSSISAILTALMDPSLYLSEADIIPVFETLITLGVFVKCDDCSILITTAQNAITSAENLINYE